MLDHLDLRYNLVLTLIGMLTVAIDMRCRDDGVDVCCNQAKVLSVLHMIGDPEGKLEAVR